MKIELTENDITVIQAALATYSLMIMTSKALLEMPERQSILDQIKMVSNKFDSLEGEI